MIRWLILLVALLPSAYLSHLAMDAPHLGRFHDDGLYWTAGRSIAEGNGYRIVSLPGQPYQTKYPPVYPLLLALICKVFPTASISILAAVWLNWLFAAGFALTAYAVASDFGLGKNTRLAVAAAVALQPLTATIGIHFLADLPFSCLALLSLAAAKRSAENGSTLQALGAGVLAGIAYLTKTTALPLLVIPAVLAWRKKPLLSIVALAPLLISIAAWNLWAHSHRSGAFLYYTDYVGYYLADLRLGDVPRILVRNLAQYVLTFGYVLSVGSLTVFKVHAAWRGITFILMGLVAIGAATHIIWNRSAAMYAAFSAAYSIMLLAWNFPPDDRFLLPLVPIVITALIRPFERSTATIAAAVIFAGMAAVFTANAIAVCQLPTYIAYQKVLKADRDKAFAWMRTHAPETAQVFTQYDSCFYMATSRPASRIELSQIDYYRGGGAAARAYRALPQDARSTETYAIETLGDSWRRSVTDAERADALTVLNNPDWFRTIYRNGTVTIYRILPAR